MKLYRFSPISSKQELFEAIEHIHFACFDLCHKALGEYLPASGNIGVFCHYQEEFELLIKIRNELTKSSDNSDQKYFELHEPIIVPEKDGVPETTYTHLYIRRVDPYRAQVGDIDFVMESVKYDEMKKSLSGGKKIDGLRIYPGDHLDMLELLNSDVDALGYVTSERIDN